MPFIIDNRTFCDVKYILTWDGKNIVFKQICCGVFYGHFELDWFSL